MKTDAFFFVKERGKENKQKKNVNYYIKKFFVNNFKNLECNTADYQVGQDNDRSYEANPPLFASRG